MGCGDTINLAETETRELDSRKGVAVGVFECRCGERIWED
jgi:hypothetical protein